ncbi:Glycoprotein-N-acetylgalactosamine 3-beta-galactosyltransferase 1 [Strongyloides ratti]|uniref:N-acetylgalactosaminide beta-1,3-galactosyltransferase n=1 Tax=Strongyloides ratti TaxID=34506 RepID=A0A090KZ18_STRRB|nr:Glycoprotein-N-acetylgalactosamine 3-beta-galactosyltransferase 1 [Strongyloides ratti]CEF62671.1 Glycoprotein-N-acetylgalactosamine 3-beta-galactosyltransferase 1 [Strongyloides ratti]
MAIYLFDKKNPTYKKEEIFNNDVINETPDFHSFSNYFASNITIFCLIHTSPKYKYSRALPQKNTWLKRCTKYIFVSIENDPELPSIKGNDYDGHEYSNIRMRFGLQYIYDKYGDKFDWIFKADDDNYAIMENLRMFLMNKNPENDYYFGFPLVEPNHNSGVVAYQQGAGFVLSKSSFRKLVTIAFKNPELCSNQPDAPDDVEFGRCLKNIGIPLSESRDINDKQPFIATNIEEASTFKKKFRWNWFKTHSTKEYPMGYYALSTFPINFHYVSGDNMYAYEYVFYQANVAGRQNPMFDSSSENDIETIYKQVKDYSQKIYKPL